MKWACRSSRACCRAITSTCLFVPPHVAISDLMQRAKGCSSYKIQMEFPEIRKRYWGRGFWARGYFCTTSGNVTDDIILQYIQSHSDKPTDASR